ncbi:WecB/TagA/CpsF family glycosyltransferase [Corynebacterium suedekumii]|nr:WecB/TagA/CpsF family glycosyltransferase [Corynebacterium suedekumii]
MQFAPDVIVLGLGAGLQDELAVELHEILPGAVICTAGGWIDQFARREQYFPAWVHSLRLGWLWRIIHEPRRLTHRYTLDAVAILLGRLAVCPGSCGPSGAAESGLPRGESAGTTSGGPAQ